MKNRSPSSLMMEKLGILAMPDCPDLGLFCPKFCGLGFRILFVDHQAMKLKRLTQICTPLLVLLFSYTAFSKLLEQDKFIFQLNLSPFPLMPDFAVPLAWILPQLELVIVALLLYPAYHRIGLVASIALLLVFELYIAGMMLTGLKLPCSCGGIISQMSWGVHLVFNAFFILFAWLELHLTGRKWPFAESPISEYLSRPEA